eukprot:973913-Pyramimonas_sp.AAC.1
MLGLWGPSLSSCRSVLCRGMRRSDPPGPRLIRSRHRQAEIVITWPVSKLLLQVANKLWHSRSSPKSLGKAVE